MKRLLIVSDNHSQEQPLEHILATHRDIDYLIHCGDSEWTPETLRLQNFIAVRGNNDLVAFSEEEVLTIDSHKVFITHGHWQSVFHDGKAVNRAGTSKLVTYALDNYHADIVFYGHTHIPEMHIDRGVFVLNPGSLNYPRSRTAPIPTYAVVTIDKKEVVAHFYQADTNEDITGKILKG